MTYTLSRIVFFPLLGFHIIPGTIAVWDVLPAWRKWFTIISYLLGFLVFILNAFWYILILKGVHKMLIALGVCSKDSLDDKQD